MAIADKTCLLVGGGLCGLITATLLARQGWRLTILDKGWGMGGRLATRRLAAGDQTAYCDYGAQYFTVTSPPFQLWLEEWLQTGLVVPWLSEVPTLKAGESGGHKIAYRGTAGNRSIAQYLAQQLAPHTLLNRHQVECLQWREHQWQVEAQCLADHSRPTFRADRLVLTMPVPQGLELLAQSAITLAPAIQAGLEAVTYAPCLTLLVLLSQAASIPAPGALQLTGEPLRWIACNFQKGISPQGYGVTIQAGADFSRRYWSLREAEITSRILAEASPWLGSEVLATSLHRWRYSQVLHPYPQPYLFVPQPGPLYWGGDGFVAGKVEGAVLSALAIAAALA
jgi:hypothetical protein